MKEEIQTLISQIVIWQNRTFTEATASSKARHLEEEVLELSQAINDKNFIGWQDRVLPELADCFILLFDICDNVGIGYRDMCEEIKKKHEVNTKRKWGSPDKHGVVKHISDDRPK